MSEHMRLSHDDSDKAESESIEQKEIIRDFIQSKKIWSSLKNMLMTVIRE